MAATEMRDDATANPESGAAPAGVEGQAEGGGPRTGEAGPPAGGEPSAAASAADATAPDPAALAARLAQAEKTASEHWERILRLQAELDNQRKRAQRDLENAHKYALENFTAELLSVRDNLERGLEAARQPDAKLADILAGTELTLKVLVQVMDKFNIQEINPLGDKFDPERHQAMMMQSVEGAEPNTVTQVIQKGYLLNDRLVRPALVAVAQ